MSKSEADQARLTAIHDMPCLPCELESEMRKKKIAQPNRTTAQHIVDNGYRALSGGDQATYPSCEWHHLGYPRKGFQSCDMEAKYGPSLFHAKKRFNARYGGERRLLQLTDERLANE